MLGTIIGANSLALPSSFSKLHLVLQNGDREFTTVEHIYEELDDIDKDYILFSSLMSVNSDTYIEYYLSKNKCKLVASKRVGVNTTDLSSIKVFCYK